MDLSKWTIPQQKVIKHKAGNLLVSASAGSGKTSVLIEKIIQLILNGGVHLKNLLVVTFTNSASAEIKQRLATAIEQSQNEKLIDELDNLSTSDILTFDAFCIKIVREFGYEIGQSNNFSVADPSLAGFLQNQALDNLFAKHNKNYDERFMNLLESFFAGRTDKNLKSCIIEFYNFLRSKSADFSYRDLLKQNFVLDDNNEVIKFLNNYLLSLRDNFLNKVENLYNQSLAFNDQKVIDGLLNSKVILESLGTSFLKNFEILKDGFKVSFPNRSEKDIAEITQIKTDFLDIKASFVKNISKIFTPEIKKLSVSIMNNDLIKTKETLEKLFDVVYEFDEEYSKLKRNYEVLDFCDIETFANRILSNRDIALSLQNRYDWIFIDEYQDTSMLQEDIVKKITLGDNLFMVGDLKQSIYRFRQAEPRIFLNKYNEYKEMKNSGSTIELKTNFRSEVDILEFDNFVFDHIYRESLDEFEYKNNADLEFGGKINAGLDNNDIKVNVLVIEKPQKSKDNPKEDDKVNLSEENTETINHDDNINNSQKLERTVYSVKNSEVIVSEEQSIQKEAQLLANEIINTLNKEYFDAKEQKMKKITFKDIAVLSRSAKSVFPTVIKVLRNIGIPVSASVEENLFDCVDMQILFNIIKAIHNLHDDISLVSAMSNIGDITFEELAYIRSNFRDCKFFYEAVEQYKNNIDDDLTAKIKMFYNKIYEYRNQSQFKSISELILTIINRENLDEYFVVNNFSSDFEEHLNLLFSCIKSINQYSLSEFISYIDAFGDNFKIQHNIKDSENAVTLSTIHASKGLEYPVVFLIGTGKELNSKGEEGKLLMDNDWGIVMNSIDINARTEYESLIKLSFKQKIKFETQKEEKRLLYVALTRPKNYLTIIGTINNNDIKSQQTDFEIRETKSYLQWILGCFDKNEINIFKTDSQYIKQLNNSKIFLQKYKSNSEIKPSLIQKKFPEQMQIDKEEFIKIISQKFDKNNMAKKNSVSQILSEEEHYNISDFNYLKNDKSGDEDFLLIGSAYHKYMELIDFSSYKEEIISQINSLKKNGKLSLDYISAVDEDVLCNAVIKLNQLIEDGNIVLKEQQFLSYMPAYQLIETDKQNKILVQGVADLIIIKNSEIYLIDYKTSRINSEEKFKQKYKTQLDIYAKSIENFYQKPVSKKMIYSFYLDKLIII